MIKLTATAPPRKTNKAFSLVFLNKVGRVIRDAIVLEAKRQAAKDLKKGTYRPFVEDQYKTDKVPEGIPKVF